MGLTQGKAGSELETCEQLCRFGLGYCICSRMQLEMHIVDVVQLLKVEKCCLATRAIPTKQAVELLLLVCLCPGADRQLPDHDNILALLQHSHE